MSGYSEKSNIQEAYLPKPNISGQIISSYALMTPYKSFLIWLGYKRLDLIQIQSRISHHGAIVLEENGGYIT